MRFDTLLYEKTDGLAVITLNRPARHNSFTLEMAGELHKAWEDVKRDPEVRCAIVTGAGEKAFCTGVDVGSVAAGAGVQPDTPPDRVPFLRMTALQNRCWKPVIAAVNGMVVGGGLHFVADSDIVVCAENATFFDTHVRVGLISGLEPVSLSRRIPLEAVMRLALLGGAERIGAQRALELGMVGAVVPLARLMPRARELAEKIAQHSPTALARSKQAIWEGLQVGLDEALAATWTMIQAHGHHPDHLEGPKAFAEKRRPRWAPYTGE